MKSQTNKQEKYQTYKQEKEQRMRQNGEQVVNSSSRYRQSVKKEEKFQNNIQSEKPQTKRGRKPLNNPTDGTNNMQ